MSDPSDSASRRARTRKNKNPQREKLTVYVSPDVAARIRGRAEQEGVSLSEIAEQLLNRAVLERAESDWWAYAGARVSQVVREEVRGMSDRIAVMMARTAIEAGMSRNLLTASLAEEKSREVVQDWVSRAEVAAVDRLRKPSQGVRELIGGQNAETQPR